MVNNNQEVIHYDGFATPSFILEGSDTKAEGSIIDKYSKTNGSNGLICGGWSRDLYDGLIHIWLEKPIPALINERDEWIAKQMLLSDEEILEYKNTPITNIKSQKVATPKQKLVLDPITKQFHLEM